MKTLPRSVRTWFLLVLLASCTNTPKPTESPKLTEATVSTQTIQPTQVAIPTDLAFSTLLVHVLSQSGLSILSVQSSTYMAMFPSTNKALWIKTNERIVESVFFADSAEAEQIHITEQPNEAEKGRYLYIIQAPPPTLLHDLTIDAAFRLYFTAAHDMLIETSSAELNKTLKHIFLEQ